MNYEEQLLLFMEEEEEDVGIRHFMELARIKLLKAADIPGLPNLLNEQADIGLLLISSLFLFEHEPEITDAINKSFVKVPIVLLTWQISAEMIRFASLHQFDDLIQLPLDRSTTQAIIDKYLTKIHCPSI